jgi:hypothetical protein
MSELGLDILQLALELSTAFRHHHYLRKREDLAKLRAPTVGAANAQPRIGVVTPLTLASKSVQYDFAA